MLWLIAAALSIALSGVPGLFFRPDRRAGERLACLLVLAGAACGFTGVAGGLLGRGGEVFTLPWSIPGGELVLRLDPLSAIFLLPLLLVLAWVRSTASATGRSASIPATAGASASSSVCSAPPCCWCWPPTTACSSCLAWEVMAVAAFFLVTTEQEKAEARRAGFIYLVADPHRGAGPLRPVCPARARYRLLALPGRGQTWPAAAPP